MDDLLSSLEGEYDLETGFIGKVRAGVFDESSLRRLTDLLKTVPPTDPEQTESRLTKLLWMMPWVVEWQAERLTREGRSADHLKRARDAILAELERIFGMPELRLSRPRPCASILLVGRSAERREPKYSGRPSE